MKLKEYIEGKHGTRQSLADASGVSYQTIKSAARGALISNYDIAKKISDATRPTPDAEPLVTIKELCEAT